MAQTGVSPAAVVEPWPFQKITARLADRKTIDKIPAVLFAPGAFSPTHKGHVLMMHQAAARLTRLGYEVLGGWLVPSNDSAVLADAQARGVPELRDTFRLKMAELNVQEDPLVAASSWECGLVNTPSDKDIARTIHAAVNTKFKGIHAYENIRVFCVVGCDRASKYRLGKGLGHSQLGVVIVPRDADECEVLLEKKDLLVHIAEPNVTEFAALRSKALREAIIAGDRDYVKKAMAFNAARFVLQPTITEIQNMKIDFENLGIINPAMEIMATDGPWPLTKLMKRLPELTDGQVPAVIIVSGSMSPVHNGHFEVLQRGRQRLEDAGIKVLAGFLSPQNATGAAIEMRAAAGSESETALSTGFRLKTTKIACVEDDFVSLGAWEASVTGRVPPPSEVMWQCKQHICEKIPSMDSTAKNIKIFYACGPGQAKRLGLGAAGVGTADRGIVIVPREDEDCFILEKPCNLFYVGPPAQGLANIVVAAKIRAAITSGDSAFVTSTCSPAVARFVLKPTESEFLAMKNDFEYLRPGEKYLTDASSQIDAREKFKAVLKAWTGPAGVIAIEDITRLLEVLDPSWTNSELSTFQSGAFGAVNKAGGIKCDDLVDWMFNGTTQ